MADGMASDRILWRIRLVHTVAWAVFATAILLIPVATLAGETGWGLVLSLVVWVEVAILAVCGWRCPLTGVAERYTGERGDNFDIFLPEWLARNNKLVFGLIFAAGEVFLLRQWLWG